MGQKKMLNINLASQQPRVRLCIGAVQSVLKICMCHTLHFHGQKGHLQFRVFNFKVVEGGKSLRRTFLRLFCWVFFGFVFGFFFKGICEQVHEGLNSETSMEMWEEQVGEQGKQNSSFPCSFIDFACVPDFYLHLLYKLV